MRANIKVKIRSVKHFLKIIKILREYQYDTVCGTTDHEELLLRRYKRKDFKRKGYVYVGAAKCSVLVFHNPSPLKYCPELTVQELRAQLYKEFINGCNDHSPPSTS